MKNEIFTTLCLVLAACGTPETEQTDETASALTGGLFVSGTCHPGVTTGPDQPAPDAAALYQRLVDAKALAESLVFTDWFRTCVEQSIPIDDEGWTAEQIVL